MFLNSVRKTEPKVLTEGPNIYGNVLIEKNAKVHETASIGPNVTIGKNCVIEEGAKLVNCVLFSDSRVGAHSYLN